MLFNVLCVLVAPPVRATFQTFLVLLLSLRLSLVRLLPQILLLVPPPHPSPGHCRRQVDCSVDLEPQVRGYKSPQNRKQARQPEAAAATGTERDEAGLPKTCHPRRGPRDRVNFSMEKEEEEE